MSSTRAPDPSPDAPTRSASTRPQRAAKIPKPAVRDGERPWTVAELRDVRASLASDIADLERDLARSETELAGLMRDSGNGMGDDEADAGTKTFEREQEMTLAANARELLAQSRQALERLDDGTFGLCESCGRPIEKLRLQAAPRATMCLECKRRAERR
ncbi:MAG: TraR/DksA family transcriptional regulator [Nostocoides sp.]